MPNSYVSVYQIGEGNRKGVPVSWGKHREKDCDVFLANAGYRDIKVSNEKQTHVAYGFQIHKNKEAVERHLWEYDWWSVARPSVNGTRGLNKKIITKALAEGGYA